MKRVIKREVSFQTLLYQHGTNCKQNKTGTLKSFKEALLNFFI